MRSGCGARGAAGGAAEGVAAIGINLAVSTDSAFDDGAGVSWRDMPNSTSACSAIETSTHRSKARSWLSGWRNPAVADDVDMGQG
jgi:hypothetical protein